MRSIFRVLLGLILAFLVSGVVQAFFIITPLDLVKLGGEALSDRLAGLGTLSLLAATQAAVFVGLPALVAIVFAERRGVRSVFLYVALGLLLAGGAALAQLISDGALTTGGDAYALTAYAATGFAAGLVYWWFAGCGAGGRGPKAPVSVV